MNSDIGGFFVRIDIPTMLGVLAWENLLLGVLVTVYRSSLRSGDRDRELVLFFVSKYAQFASWVLVNVSSAEIPFPLIVIGNTLLFSGAYAESLVILRIVGIKLKRAYRLHAGVFAAMLMYFFAKEALAGFSRDFFFLSHLVITVLFLFPGLACLLWSGNSLLKRVMGILYVLFFLSSVYRFAFDLVGLRAFPGKPLFDEGFFFFMYVSILLVGGAGFLLLVKEDDDRRLLEMAYLDSLTGLLNRRHFSEEASISLARHVRSGKEMSMLFIDIDYFKKVNDTYGHEFGDEVLRNLASLMRKTVRTTDLACRWGGEEFVILLSESGSEHARMVARRIQQGISFSTFAAHGDFSYTISVGIHSTVPRTGPEDTLESFIEKSDRAMYRAKVLGRNRVEVFGSDMPPFAPE